MSAPLVPRVIAASVQIQTAVSLVTALEPGTKEAHAKLVNTVKHYNFTLTIKHICEIEFACYIKKLNS